MAECSLSMTPLVTHPQFLRSAHSGDFLAERVVSSRDREVLDILVSLGFVDSHVENTEMQLAEVEKGIVDVFRADQVLDHIVGDAFGRLGLAIGLLFPSGEVLRGDGRVVLAEGFELRGSPAPVLEHLAGCFDEIAHGAGAVETRVDGPGDEVVDTVAEFMEEGYHFVVFEEARFLFARLGEVTD